jgi:hypothetical protein
MTVLLKNNAYGYLSSAVTDTATSIILTTGTGANFPNVGSGEYFYATISTTGGAYEVVKCTARSGDALTITRGQEGTNPASFPAGSLVEARVTAQSVIDAIDDRINLNAEWVTPRAFGAVGNGVTDDTTALRNTFAYATPLGKTVVLEGTYLISGYIGLNSTVASGSLHIYCDGPVTIQVSGSATAFRQVLFFGSTDITSASITGGPLAINCNNKAATGIEIYSASSTLYGAVTFSAAVTVNDCTANDAAATYENGGIIVNGRFEQIFMNSPRVENVARTNTSGGACSGITVTSLAGECYICDPVIINILCPNGTNGVDADGIKIFGVNNAASPAVQTLGKATIQGGTFVDCQGRSVKSQCSDTTLIGPTFKRQLHVSIINSHDVDFQSGNGLIIEPTFEYKKNSTVSPLGTSHRPVAFQQRVSNLPQLGKCMGGSLKTEVDMPGFAILVQESTSAFSETVIDGLVVEPFGTLTTTAFTRAILETDMEVINGKTAGTKMVVSNVSGPMNCTGIGYTAYTTGSLAAKLEYEVTDLKSTLTPTDSRLFHNLSGNQVGEVKAFLVRDNANFRDLFLNAVFNFNNLVPGCKFTVLTDSVTATNAPSWGVGRYAFIEVLGGPGDAPITATNRNVRVTVTDASTNLVENVFYSVNGGTTWSETLFGTTSGTTKTVTGKLVVDGQTQLGTSIPAYTKLIINGTLPSSTGASYSFINSGTIPSTTTDYMAYRSGAGTENAAFTLGSYIHYYAVQGTVTGGSRTAPTSQYGFAVDSSLVGATSNYGFWSNIPTAANRYNFVAAGTAPSFFVGAIGWISSTLTIASGAITAQRNYHLVAGEGGLADDLTDITAAVDGQMLVLRAASDSVTITVKSTGNIKTSGADMVLDNQYDTITLIYDSALSLWLEIARSNNGA